MRRIFIDTNVLLRPFVNDDSRQVAEAVSLFQRAADGEIELLVGPPILFEAAWTLRRYHKVEENKILDVLSVILDMKGITVLDRELVVEAIELARKNNVEFADSYIAASIRHTGVDGLATFNRRHFSSLHIALEPMGNGVCVANEPKNNIRKK